MNGPENQHEERLLIEAAQKDPSRFAELYELHFERVYGYIVRRVRERSAAEELTVARFFIKLSQTWVNSSGAARLLRRGSSA